MNKRIPIIILAAIMIATFQWPTHSAKGEASLGAIVAIKPAGGTEWAGPIRMEADLRELLKAAPAGFSEDNPLAALSDRHLILSRLDSDNEIPAQWSPRFDEEGKPDPSAGFLIWRPDWSAGNKFENETRYTLQLRPGDFPYHPFKAEDRNGESLLLTFQGKPVLQYNYGVIQEKPGEIGSYDRACYIHPAWTPDGNIVTGDFSPEHIHQRGIFMAWRQAKFGETETDFWGLGDTTGRVLPSGLSPRMILGPNFAKLTFINQGVVEDRPVFRERVEITVYAGQYHEGWLFDFGVWQRPLKAAPPMELPVIHYGGMSFRGPTEWLSRESGAIKGAMARGAVFKNDRWLPSDVRLDVLTSEGKDRSAGDRSAARWIDYTGPFAEGWGGVAMFDHPASPRFPTPLRVHPELPYFSWAFVQNDPYVIRPEKPLELSYRVWVHDGRPDAEMDERIAAGFQTTPRIVWNPGD